MDVGMFQKICRKVLLFISLYRITPSLFVLNWRKYFYSKALRGQRIQNRYYNLDVRGPSIKNVVLPSIVTRRHLLLNVSQFSLVRLKSFLVPSIWPSRNTDSSCKNNLIRLKHGTNVRRGQIRWSCHNSMINVKLCHTSMINVKLAMC